MSESRCVQGIWSSPWIFIFAASGSAVGLGNMWKFPYMVGESGGGAFLFVYMLCLVFVGLPVLIAEVALGRSVRSNPIDTIKDLQQRHLLSRGWQIVPWLSGVTGVLILSFYSVIAGWTLSYFEMSITHELAHIDLLQAQSVFTQLLASPFDMLLWHTLFMGVVILTVGQSVTRGLGQVVKILLPLLVLILMLLAIYALSVGDVARTMEFLFAWKWRDITSDVVFSAVSHAFFSLSIGIGGMFAYGAYMSKHLSIAKACTFVVAIDLLVALLAGIVIFPLVFATNIDVASGPSLTFISLPVIFAGLPLAQFVGAAFFLLMALAALTSAISMLELFVAWLHERFYIARLKAAMMLGILAWAIGLMALLSLNDWSMHLVFGMNFFEWLNALTSTFLLPLIALLLSVLVAWQLPRHFLENELITRNQQHFQIWYVTLKFVSVPTMLLILILGWIGGGG